MCTHNCRWACTAPLLFSHCAEDAAHWITQDFYQIDELCVACRHCHLHRLTWL